MSKIFVLTVLAAAVLCFGANTVRKLPSIRVSENRRFLVDASGKPFFYLGDTAWELFHRLNREQASEYLKVRAEQGFTVVQAVALAELDGVGDPNAYGRLPLVDRDPARPAVTPGADPANRTQYDYWDHVEYIIDEANRHGIYVGLLPTWGRWVVPNPKASQEAIFTVANAETYGRFLGRRFGTKGILWILGGDRSADGVQDVWRAMARGIAIGAVGSEDYGKVLMSFHPVGGATSSSAFHTDPWLGFNMQQTGHGLAERVQSWKKIQSDYELQPVKPVIDGEPLYEDHPLAFRSKLNGYSFDAHVRQRAYWDLFSGACGHTYGNHAVWQMNAPGKAPINGPLMYWNEAIHRPGANQMRYVRALIESRPMLSRVPDQSLVVDALDGADHIAATRGEGYAFVYDAQGRPFRIRMGKISGDRVRCTWYNPRSGDSMEAGILENQGEHEFTAPSEGFGSDWVLVVDDVSKNYRMPVRTGAVVY